MSAPVLHLLAFSAPVVNGDSVSVLANFGKTSAELSGSRSLFGSLARAILANESPEKIVLAPKGGTGRPRGSGPNPNHEKYARIQAELARDSSRGRLAALCREEGVGPGGYHFWLAHPKPAASAAH